MISLDSPFRWLLCAGFALLVPFASAAADTDTNWSVEQVDAATGRAQLNLRAGTWMSLDVSPDGRHIVFDLLGDIYRMPIEGGRAEPLTSGMAWDRQPRYSPDGAEIAFISDAGGGDNIWLLNLESGKPFELTTEDFRLLSNAEYSPDGRFLLARKHFTTRRSLGTGELWLYHRAGGAGQPLLVRPDEALQKEVGEPVFAPSGEFVYFSKDTTPGSTFQYAQNSHGQVFEILELEVATGEVRSKVSGAGGAARPTPSPDGRLLAFVRRTGGVTGLWVRDLQADSERLLAAPLDMDMQEVWAVHGVYPNMAFTPDSRSLLFWAGGEIRRVDVDSGAQQTVPFEVQDERAFIPVTRPALSAFEPQFSTQMARRPALSPDGQRVVFETLGRLYVKRLPDGKPQRLTTDSERRMESHATFSPDSRSVVFVTWDDVELGSVRTVSARGGRSRAISTQPGHYVEPAFAPDGGAVVYRNLGRSALRAPAWGQAGIYLQAGDAPPLRLSREGARPHFDSSGERVYYTRFNGKAALLESVDRNAGDKRVHASGAMVTEYMVAPSGKWLAYRENYDVHVTPFTGLGVRDASAKTLPKVGREARTLPNRPLSDPGGNHPAWAGDYLVWGLGAQAYRVNSDQIDKLAVATESAAPALAAAEVIDLSQTITADRPDGALLLRNARVLTMDPERAAEGVIESGSVLIEGNRISAVFEGVPEALPEGVQQVDLSGKTLIPGLIDAHAHGPQASGLMPEANWVNHATLAFGVTTIHNPSVSAVDFFAASDMQRSGAILAPRLFATGDIVYGARSSYFAFIDHYDDALDHVQRLKAQGATSIKNYNQPRRDQRQQVVAAAQAEGLMVVAEGGALFHMDLSLVADGNTGIEHNLPQAVLYEDVLQFWEQTEVGYTPTLVVSYGGLTAEHYYYAHTDVWRHPLLTAFVPPSVLAPVAIRRSIAPKEDYQFIRAAAAAATLGRRGVLVSIGAHGQREGLASHWELWAFVEGGMTPLEALRTATLNPAQHLGLATDLGTITPGKLADLVILDGNPLSDISATETVSSVVLNGRLYEAATLAEQVTGSRSAPSYYWQRENASN